MNDISFAALKMLKEELQLLRKDLQELHQIKK